MLSIDQLSLLVQDHLKGIEPDGYYKKWTIKVSDLSGRGLFAAEDIGSGELLFVDHPLVYGPRSGNNIQRGCTVCGKIDVEAMFQCSKCGLLLCSERCQDSNTHYVDCITISSWSNKVPIESMNDTLLSRCLAAVRMLSLNEDQQQLLRALQSHILPQHGSEIKQLKHYFEISADVERLLILAVCTLDANAFQIAVPYGRKGVSSMRGLFPVSSLMNHNCAPNTKYSFNEKNHMVVKAVKPIPAGTELTTCYTGLLWGTPARRLHLFKTKHFWCKCERCADTTERGTLLAALKCFKPSCPSSLLPIEPLKPNSAWRCNGCDLRVPHNNIAAIQSALGSLIGSLNFVNVAELEKFYLTRVYKYVPETNQIVMDLQLRIIWEFGEVDGYRWHELSESRLALKESLCRRALVTVAALGLGDTHLRGLLLYHLHTTLAERAHRNPELYEEFKAEIESTIEHAYNILKGDISSPSDLELRRQCLGAASVKPQRLTILDKTMNF